MTIPNPAHAQFVSRNAADPVGETQALSMTRVRQLLGLSTENSVLSYRDRAILKLYVYSGARLAAGCLLRIEDFHDDPEGTTIRLAEKGARRRTIGLHFNAVEAIRE